jgi:hypothetical protein
VAYIPIYLTTKFLYRLQEFLEHWYLGGFRVVSHTAVSLLEFIDSKLALVVTLRYIFQPLFQDRGVIAHVLGFIFRTARIIIAVSIYSVIISGALAIYLIWLVIPPYLVYQTLVAYNLVSQISVLPIMPW